MGIVWTCLKWLVRTVLTCLAVVLLILLLWPLPSIRPVRVAEPATLSPEAMLIFTEELRYVSQSARLLLKDDSSGGLQWHLRNAVLGFRLALFTTELQRAVFVAQSIDYGFGTQDFPTFTEGCFGMRPEALDLAEAAELARRMRSPSLYKGEGGLERLRGDRDDLLKDLAAAGRISTDALDAALSKPVGTCQR